MKITTDKLHGFSVTAKEYVREIDATLFDLTHDKSGARLLFLDRSDENTTFAIGFKTTPTDDTGVFHIMEHSVLCGSKKFPVKDPLTELLKGSVSTYLNALTSGDKTVYPVSSKNAKSFRGLVDVYLDAVFNPLVLENPYIFMQEGHRYELDGEGELTVTGVVYNEMKGVYSTADDYADYLISRLICPGSTYSYDSGGNPDFITDLTYEDLKRAHDKFYHPSNACIFLDGDVIIDEILPLIDSYLSVYERRDDKIEINDGESPITEVCIDTYPIEKGESPTDKTKVYLCYNSYRHSERAELSALSVVTEALSDLNTAPLTKIILDSGLCESFSFYTTRSYSLNSLNVSFSGVKDGKEKELISVFETGVKKIIGDGIPRDILSSALKRREFNMREADYDTFPAGMVYMRSCMDYAMLGEDPSTPLKYEQLIAFLYDNLNTRYYEDILSSVTSSPRATLILHPDPDFITRKDAELKDSLCTRLSSMSDDDIEALKEESLRFEEWQNAEDSPEALATIPAISIDDLKTEPKRIPTEVVESDGCEIIIHPLHTGGISYADLYFSVDDADEEELHYIRLFTDLVFEWNTRKGSITDFRNRTKTHLGAFYLTLHPTKKDNAPKLYLLLHASCLDSERKMAADIINEYLYDTLFDDKEILKKNLRQIYTFSLESITSRGDMYANLHDAAKHSSYDALVEHLFGYEYHVFIKELLDSVDERGDYVLERFEKIREKYFKRERLTVGLTGTDTEGYGKELIGAVYAGGTKSSPSKVEPIAHLNEGIAIPASVSFVSRSGNLGEVGENLYTGAYQLLQSIASFEILWNEIRLKNGAYDTGFFAKPTGSVGCYSYRDPSPSASVEYFGHVCDEISAFLDTEPDLLRYVIGVFGASDTVTTPRSDGALATKRYLSGKTYEKIVESRKECLDATVDELRRINEVIRSALDSSTFTVVGSRDELEKIDGIDRILDI